MTEAKSSDDPRLVWHSNAPWCGSGYGTQTGIFAPALIEMGWPLDVSCSYGLQGNILNPGEGVRYFPSNSGPDPYGAEVGPNYAAMAKASVFVTLLDAWVFDGERIHERGLRWVPYAPVDHEPIPRAVHQALLRSWLPIAMSRFGENEMRENDLEPMYLPHAFNGEDYYPLGGERAKTRDEMGVPQDAFVVLIVGANKGPFPRKNIPLMMQAVADMQRDHDDVWLCMHTQMDSRAGGLDLGMNVALTGLDEARLKVGDQTFTLSPESMRRLYGIADVLLHVSCGEGFGIPLIEAQACGTPVITGEWTSQGELQPNEDLLIRRDDSALIKSPQLSGWYMTEANVMRSRLQVVYEASAAERQAWRSRSIEFASEYEHKHVIDTYLRPISDAIRERMADEDAGSKVEVTA